MTVQPDPDPEHRTLVEREGVNAGSDRSSVEGDADMVSPRVASEYDDTGARPTSAQDENGSGDVAADGHAIGAPATVVGGGHPPQQLDGDAEVAELVEQGRAMHPSESGQDNGSMG
jgi:hypothetical protein